MAMGIANTLEGGLDAYYADENIERRCTKCKGKTAIKSIEFGVSFSERVKSRNRHIGTINFKLNPKNIHGMIDFGEVEWQKFLNAPKHPYLTINQDANKYQFSPKDDFYTFCTKNQEARLNTTVAERRQWTELMWLEPLVLFLNLRMQLISSELNEKSHTVWYQKYYLNTYNLPIDC